MEIAENEYADLPLFPGLGETRTAFALARIGLLIIAFALCSCIGDASVRVTFVNDVGSPITVYPLGRDYPSSKSVIAPSDEKSMNLPIGAGQPSRTVARVEAVTSDGALVFCHVYTYAELLELKSTVHVRPGVLDCA